MSEAPKRASEITDLPAHALAAAIEGDQREPNII